MKFRGAVGLSSLSQSLVESVSFRLAGCLCKFMPVRQTCVAAAALPPSAARGPRTRRGEARTKAQEEEKERERIMMRIIGNKWK